MQFIFNYRFYVCIWVELYHYNNIMTHIYISPLVEYYVLVLKFTYGHELMGDREWPVLLTRFKYIVNYFLTCEKLTKYFEPAMRYVF